MNKFDIIFEALHDRVNAGELNADIAREVTKLAYIKYVTEASKKDADKAEEIGRKNLTLRKGANISNDGIYKAERNIIAKFDPEHLKDYPERKNSYDKTSISDLSRNHKISASTRATDGTVPDYGANPEYSKDANKNAVKKYKDSMKNKNIDVEKSISKVSGDSKKKILKNRLEQGKKIPDTMKKYITKKEPDGVVKNDRNSKSFYQKIFSDDEKDKYEKMKSYIQTMKSTKDYAEYKKAHDGLAKMTGHKSTDSFACCRVEDDTNKIYFNSYPEGKTDLVNKKDKMNHASSNSNLKELTPTFKSTDGVFYGSPRIYFHKNEEGSKMAGGINKKNETLYKIKHKIQKAHVDEELQGNARYVNTTHELKVDKK